MYPLNKGAWSFLYDERVLPSLPSSFWHPRPKDTECNTLVLVGGTSIVIAVSISARP